MKNYRKHIDDFFREKLGNYTETPPADVWDDLSQRLEGLAPPTGVPSRWFVHLTIASLLVVLGVSVLRKAPFNSYSPGFAMNENSVTAKVATAGTSSTVPGTQSQSANAAAPGNNTAPGNNNAGIAANETVAANQGTGQQVAPSSASEPGTGDRNVIAKKQAKNQHSSGNQKSTGTAPRYGLASEYPAGGIAKGPNANETTHEIVTGAGTTDANAKAPVTPSTKQVVNATKESPLPSITKKAEKPANTPVQKLSQWEMGVKGGYETGLNRGGATKYVISPYLQYNLVQKFALLIQPAIKEATIKTVNVGTTQSDYQATGVGTATNPQDNYTTTSIGSTTYYHHSTTYTYSQSFASVVKNYTYGGTCTEFELPILLKYQLVKNLSAYGGVSVNFAKLVSLAEHASTKSVTVSKNATSTDTTNSATVFASALPISSVISAPTSETKSPVVVSPNGNILTVGYMLGFSYEYNRRWLLDGLIQQSPVKSDMQGSSNLNAPFSSTYIRFTIGYKIIH